MHLIGNKLKLIALCLILIFVFSISQSLARSHRDSSNANRDPKTAQNILVPLKDLHRQRFLKPEPVQVPIKIVQNMCVQECLGQANLCNSPCFRKSRSPGRKRCHETCKSMFNQCKVNCEVQTNIEPKEYKNDIPVIDVHAHLNALISQSLEQKRKLDFSGAADQAIKLMDRYSVRTSIIMVPPAKVAPVNLGRINVRSLLEQSERYPGRFFVLGGGGSLNPMIQSTPSDQVTKEIKEEFERRAEGLLRRGAVGFGEMAALHFSFHKNHPPENTQPDHPLFLLLADIAARHNVPIDLHNEIVSRDIKVPQLLRKRNQKNPSRVIENITGLEKLLSHNRRTIIILSHSTDATGHRTARTIRRLMERHSNLMMSLNVLPQFPFQQNLPLRTSGGIKKDWLQLIKDYPDRFLIGSDQFYNNPCPTCARVDFVGPSLRWLQLLPSDIAKKIAIENPQRIFKQKPKRVTSLSGQYLSEKDIAANFIGKTLKIRWMNGVDMELTYEQGGSLSILTSRFPGRTIHKRWWVSNDNALCITIGPHDRQHCAKVQFGKSSNTFSFESSNEQRHYDGILLD